jgi:hypothetical protein
MAQQETTQCAMYYYLYICTYHHSLYYSHSPSDPQEAACLDAFTFSQEAYLISQSINNHRICYRAIEVYGEDMRNNDRGHDYSLDYVLHRIMDYKCRGDTQGVREWVVMGEMRVVEEMLAIRDERKLRYLIQLLKHTFGEEAVENEDILKVVIGQ